MDVNAIVDAVIARLEPLPGTKLDHMPKAPIPPLPNILVIVDFDMDEHVDYDVTVGQGSHDLYLAVILLFGNHDDRLSYRRLNEFISFPGLLSVKETLEQDQTLGGTVNSLQVLNPKKGGPQIWPDNRLFLGITFPLVVEAF